MGAVEQLLLALSLFVREYPVYEIGSSAVTGSVPQTVLASAVASLKPFALRLATAELAASWAVAPEPPAYSVRLLLGLTAIATHRGEEAMMTQPE
jgi:hypothetical protein